MALALVRYQFRGRAATNLFIFIPLATPEVVLGASLLSLFISVGFARGFATILIAHVMFSVSFVVVTVRSRLIGFDRSIEEAAQDLGANGVQTFFRVTLPLIAPAVLAAALLTFALSLDDFVITNFNAGSTITYPLYIWGAARGLDPAAGERPGGDDLPVHRGGDAPHGLAAATCRAAGVGTTRKRGGLRWRQRLRSAASTA